MWYAHLDLGVVGDGGLTVFGRHRHLEDAEAVLGHGRGIAVPAVKVADEECTHGIGRPLAVHDVAIGLDVEAVDLVALQGGQHGNRTPSLEDLTLENFSRPPSVSSIVLIHFCVLAKRLRSAPLKGSR
jgi:hypothetical protein